MRTSSWRAFAVELTRKCADRDTGAIPVLYFRGRCCRGKTRACRLGLCASRRRMRNGPLPLSLGGDVHESTGLQGVSLRGGQHVCFNKRAHAAAQSEFVGNVVRPVQDMSTGGAW